MLPSTDFTAVDNQPAQVINSFLLFQTKEPGGVWTVNQPVKQLCEVIVYCASFYYNYGQK